MAVLEGCSCANVIKWMHFVFNFIFWAGGLVILGLGIWLYVSFGDFLDDLAGVSWLSAPIILIAVGSIITVLGFLGCCGACMENKWCLYVFGVLLTITLLLEIAGGAVLYAKRHDVEDDLKKAFFESQETYVFEEPEGSKDPVTKGWDTVQLKFDCCGTNGSRDWITSSLAANKTFSSYPSSCCGFDDRDRSCNASTAALREGCYEAVKDMVTKNIIPIGIGVTAMGCIQIIGIVFAFYLGRTIGKETVKFV
ncbi:tetraspanin-9-like [Oscarella lobularis]|uniref:tetraspanin-9-like n=1 Tax=Oscarella lobularis TaxID=121494 RepID=UPI003313E870